MPIPPIRLSVKAKLALSTALLLLLCLTPARAQSPSTVSTEGTTSTATREVPSDHIFKACASPTPEKMRAIQLRLEHDTVNLRRFKIYELPLQRFVGALVRFYENRRLVCEYLLSEQGPEASRRMDASAKEVTEPTGCSAFSAARSAYLGAVGNIDSKFSMLSLRAKATTESLEEALVSMGSIQPSPEELQAHPEEYKLANKEMRKLFGWIDRIERQKQVDTAPYKEQILSYLADIQSLETRFAACSKPAVNVRRVPRF